MRSKLKEILIRQPLLWRSYQSLKHRYIRLKELALHISDARRTYQHMTWRFAHTTQKSLSAELLFQYHKLEKGLVMPGPPRMFGIEPAQATMDLVARWHQMGFPQHDPVYVGAIETLHSYLNKISRLGLDKSGKTSQRVATFLSTVSARSADLNTPQPLSRVQDPAQAYQTMVALANSRRSVRHFKPTPPELDKVENAIRIAMLSPSACNRQPWQIRLLTKRDLIDKILAHQNGNRGFDHVIPCVAIVTMDHKCFFGPTERHQPFVDGGLFSMSFIYGLASQGISSCCLNWCASKADDVQAHRKFDIPDNESIIMLIAIGYAEEDISVPRSPRRDISEVIHIN